MSKSIREFDQGGESIAAELDHLHAESIRLTARIAELESAGQAVVDRWRSPKWASESEHTGVLIDRLHTAATTSATGEATGSIAAEAVKD